MHHTETLAEEPNDKVVHEEWEEGSVGEVAEKQRVHVAFVQAVRAEREVIHVRKSVVRRPHHVESVEETVRDDNGDSNVATWHA